MKNAIYACCFFAWAFMLGYMFLIILGGSAAENKQTPGLSSSQEAIELSIELTRLKIKKLEAEL